MEGDETQRIEKAAAHAMAAFYNSGARPPDHLSSGDLKQAAREAALAGLEAMDRTFTENEQEAYLARRALGGIQNACWARRRGKDQRLREQEKATISLDALPEHVRDASELVERVTPEQLATVAQAIRAIQAMPHPFPTIVQLRLAGYEGQEIAQHIGVSSGRVSQLFAALARRLGRFMAVPKET